MRYLLDTGILVRILHHSDPHYSSIRQSLRSLSAAKHTFVTARQNVVEFWNVCTRPASARGGFNLSVEETSARLRILERWVDVLNEPDSVYPRWKSLVTRHLVCGKQVHDARIVAVMTAYRIRRILTLNAADFARYPSIFAVSPDAFLQQPAQIV
jgi:predicted nucleic acid-binding protein